MPFLRKQVKMWIRSDVRTDLAEEFYESYVNNHSLSFSFTGYKEQNDEGTAYKRDVN